MPEAEAEEEEGQGAEERYWRERKAAALRAGIYGQEDAKECEVRLARLAEAAKAARPWAARVQAATAAHSKASSNLQAVEADLAAAKAAVAALEEARAAACEAVQAAAKQLQQVKGEAAASTPVPGTPNMEELVERLVRLAAEVGLDVTSLTGRVAEAEVRRRQAQRSSQGAAQGTPQQPPPPTPQDTQVYVPASLLDAALETQSQRSEMPMDTNSSQRKGAIDQKGRRSRSRGPGKEDEGLSDAGSTAVGGRPRHR